MNDCNLHVHRYLYMYDHLIRCRKKHLTSISPNKKQETSLALMRKGWMLYPNIRKKAKMSLSTNSIQIVLMFLVIEIKKRYKRHQIGKEAEKLINSWHDCLCRKSDEIYFFKATKSNNFRRSHFSILPTNNQQFLKYHSE